MQILALSGSLRRDSYNTALLRAAAELLPDGATLSLYDYSDVPLYNADLDDPPAVTALKQAIADADAVLIATPEYNHGIPGVLKNAIDWASRPGFRSCLVDKPIGIIGAAPSLVGTTRAQAALRRVLFSTLAHIYPAREVAVGQVAGKIVDGKLIDQGTRDFLGGWLEGFVPWAKRVTPDG